MRNFSNNMSIQKLHSMLRRLVIILMMAGLWSACSTVKYVPEDKYLLNKVRVKADTKDVSTDRLRGYLRQKQNSEILGFWKLQLQVYSLSGADTTKRFNRALRKMGEAPEIFDPAMAEQSRQQLKKAMFNSGYFDAEVDTAMFFKDKRLTLEYRVTAGEPYRIRKYQVDLPKGDLKDYATTARRSRVKPDAIFDSEVMDEERTRLTNAMRNSGYYYFDKSMLEYDADSALNQHKVDVEMHLAPYVEVMNDSLQKALFTQYRISRVEYYTDYDPANTPDSLKIVTRESGDYSFSYVGHRLIRDNVLKRNTFIVPGELYRQLNVERTYAALNALGPIKYVDISFRPDGEDQLVCQIVLTRGKLNNVSAEIEGTYSAGDWGIAGGVGYVNRNFFRGAEQFSLNAKASYEWRQNGGRAIEAKGEAAIQFTNAPKVTLGYQYQNRPEEFTRNIAHAGISYNYQKYRSQWSHRFNLVDINYVYLPWISEEFAAIFLLNNNVLRYSYQNHFILGWSYSGSYTSKRAYQPLRSYIDFNYSIETAGNLLYGISELLGLPRDEEDGAYKIGKIRYAQYAKVDLGFTFNEIFNKNHRLVYHAFLGVAVPYLNATSVPFEKRYYSGGPNSVRGWTARSLGPGAYRGNGTRIDYNNQAGDIKLDLNLEYRWNVWSIIQLAAFTDAGNIWTIREYESQPHGAFKWDEFYKQIAWSYGVGLRLDFSMVVLRLDFGVKLYDPSRMYTDGKVWRTAPAGLSWKDDMSLHFAIGYPF